MEKYELQEIIGEGWNLFRTYGTVYKAIHKS